MGRPTYYCYRCKRNHFYTSKTGRLHRGGFARGSTTKRTSKKQPRSKTPRRRSPRQVRVAALPSDDRQRPTKTTESPWVGRREDARSVVEGFSGTAAGAVAVILFDPGSRYRMMADEILSRMPWYRGANRGHWLCRRLEEAATALSPGTYLDRIGTAITTELVAKGVPQFAAQVIAKSMATATGRVVGSLGTDQLITTLRALVPLVCPNFERCPTQRSVCSHFVAPGIEEVLRSAL